MDLFQKNKRFLSYWKLLTKRVETLLKCLILFSYPLLTVAIITPLWYFVLYQNGICLSPQTEGIVSAAWIPTFGILYSIMASVVMSTVWAEYKKVRVAVKRYDFEAFCDLRDERMSPLVYALMRMLSFAVLAAFASLKYSRAIDGAILVSGMTYMFSLVMWVIKEIDDPFSGLWFIKRMPDGWLTLDVKAYRQRRWDKMKEVSPQ